jgi:hypothetical protein
MPPIITVTVTAPTTAAIAYETPSDKVLELSSYKYNIT